eukprot:1159941-Pelagomonas_calceolata.AAC.4
MAGRQGISESNEGQVCRGFKHLNCSPISGTHQEIGAHTWIEYQGKQNTRSSLNRQKRPGPSDCNFVHLSYCIEEGKTKSKSNLANPVESVPNRAWMHQLDWVAWSLLLHSWMILVRAEYLIALEMPVG